MHRRNFLRSLILVAASPLILSNAHASTRQISGTVFPSVATRKLRFTLTIENPDAQTLLDQRVWLYMPAKHTATQTLTEINVSMPHHITEDVLGNTIVELAWNSFPAFAAKIVSLDVQLRMLSEPEMQPLAMRDIFLADEQFIEVNAPGIQALAHKLKRDDTLSTARSIYDWVRTNLRYAGFIADDLGAGYALKNRRGDCTEYAYLAVALARASGIPARVLGGYVVARDAAPRAADYHNWAEVYFDRTWHLLDAQKENFMANTEQYVTFRIVSGQTKNVLDTAHRFKSSGRLVVQAG